MTQPFRVIAADPPWKFGDKLPGNGRGAAKHYEVMPTEDICMLALPPIADDAMLFLWRVAGMQQDALNVLHMWGFELKSELVWVKTKDGVVIEDWTKVREEDLAFGMGRYTRHCHEVCLIGTRGKAATRIMKDHSTRSVFFAEREEHSKKPDKFYDIVEKLTGAEGPYLELFARRRRNGWITLGNELGSTLGKVIGDQHGDQGSDEDAGRDPQPRGAQGAEPPASGGDRGAPRETQDAEASASAA